MIGKLDLPRFHGGSDGAHIIALAQIWAGIWGSTNFFNYPFIF